MRSFIAAVLRAGGAPPSRRVRCYSSSPSGALAALATHHRSQLVQNHSTMTTTTTASSLPPQHNHRRHFSQHRPQPLRLAASPADTSEPPPPPPPAPSTHYDLFPATLPLGPPPRGHFPIDTRALRREFLSLQARAHPDLHPPGAAKTSAAALSARINDAYRTLANPLLRAQYLLALRGVDVAADERLKVDEPALLGEVLEAREEIEEARVEEDLEPAREANEARIAAGEEALEVAFREDDVEAAKREAVRMRYWVNIRESLDNWEPGKPIVLEH
ncbi:co-chaperone protein HscB [Cordyceps fumosorosea ARSEF 2679]|uniref:Co-chaperone protein HscB n=1 Tax=Cordyceps fumosorosea (strain ARSEF 2679) TaxID=1081104 RepID=A0A168E8P1_CORFA|nr:co-chaperone protein HscB [Cordyceps fumosorosea ARSEF 2679]OAA73507.1 co-chaperone protein HscB [Cordyceps fumosorosea ARSEF 2679]